MLISYSITTSLKGTDVDDGSMNQKERQKVVDEIKTDEDTRIILMSFKAGGVGKSAIFWATLRTNLRHDVRSQLDRL